jgi:hypothetical protein
MFIYKASGPPWPYYSNLLNRSCDAIGDHRNSDQRYELALGVGVAVNVSLSGLDRFVPGQQLHVPQRATGFVDQPRSPSDEGAAAGMGGAAFQPNCPKRPSKPADDTDRTHRATTFRPNDRTFRCALKVSQLDQSRMQFRVDRNDSTAALLCYSVSQFEGPADLAGGVNHHWPGQVSDLTGPETGLDRQQDQAWLRRGCRIWAAKTRRSSTFSSDKIFARLQIILAIHRTEK